jgi:hypothetical protein
VEDRRVLLALPTARLQLEALTQLAEELGRRLDDGERDLVLVLEAAPEPSELLPCLPLEREAVEPHDRRDVLPFDERDPAAAPRGVDEHRDRGVVVGQVGDEHEAAGRLERRLDQLAQGLLVPRERPVHRAVHVLHHLELALPAAQREDAGELAALPGGADREALVPRERAPQQRSQSKRRNG